MKVGWLRVTHPFAALLVFTTEVGPTFSLDLHVLSAPLAFILSRDHTRS